MRNFNTSVSIAKTKEFEQAEARYSGCYMTKWSHTTFSIAADLQTETVIRYGCRSIAQTFF